MKNKNYKNKSKNEQEIEDVSKYGEFVSSYFAWLTLDKQKENAKQMQKMTKKSNQGY